MLQADLCTLGTPETTIDETRASRWTLFEYVLSSWFVTRSHTSGSGSGAGRVDTGYVSGSSPGKDSFDGLPYYSALEDQD